MPQDSTPTAMSKKWFDGIDLTVKQWRRVRTHHDAKTSRDSMQLRSMQRRPAAVPAAAAGGRKVVPA